MKMVHHALQRGVIAVGLAIWLWPGPTIAGQKLALVVGINRYEHDQLTPLKFAVRDATELGRILQSKGGFTVTVLTDDSPTKPSRANILQKVRTVLDKCQKGDTALLAFAGHGAQFDGGDAFFCPVDGKPFPDRADTLVSLTEIYKQLEQSFAGVRVLLVDACRDDPTSSRGLNADNTPRPPRGVAALFSCSAGERAFEAASLQHGVFFHHVLRGLDGDAKDKDGEVTFEGLSAYVRKRVSRQVPELIGGGAKQSPNLKADLSGESPVLISGLGTGTPPQDTDRPMTLMEYIAFKKIRLTRRSDRPDPKGIIEIHFPDSTTNEDLARVGTGLPTLTGLESINLGGAKITDAGLVALSNSRTIKSLILSDTNIGDDGMKHLTPMTVLEVLDLGGTPVGDSGLADVAKIVGLKRLILADTSVTDLGLVHLTKLPQLESIDLGRTKVTAVGIASIAGLPKLQRLRIPGTKITATELAQLRQRYPKLTID